MPEGANILLRGFFTPQYSPGVGEAIIYIKDGQPMLRLKDFQTNDGPDLKVYLSSDLTSENGIDIGPIQGLDGTYDYPIDPSVDIFGKNNVLIWCAAFDVVFTSASLS